MWLNFKKKKMLTLSKWIIRPVMWSKRIHNGSRKAYTKITMSYNYAQLSRCCHRRLAPPPCSSLAPPSCPYMATSNYTAGCDLNHYPKKRKSWMMMMMMSVEIFPIWCKISVWFRGGCCNQFRNNVNPAPTPTVTPNTHTTHIHLPTHPLPPPPPSTHCKWL